MCRCLHAAAKVIMLLSSGAQSESESLSDITRVISDGKQLVGQQVVILAFGLNTGWQSKQHMNW